MRRNLAARELARQLDETCCLKPVRGENGDISGWHIVPMWYEAEHCGGMPRQRFVLSLLAEGIPCSTGWPSPLDRLPPFRDAAEPRATPTTERACAEQVWIDGRLLLMEDGVPRFLEALAQIKARRRR
jgi:hypothetical protein